MKVLNKYNEDISKNFENEIKKLYLICNDDN